MRRLVAAACVAVVLAGACQREVDGRVALDGSPRVPDAEGIVREVTRERLVLDGDRTYEIGDELQSFSSQTMKAVPVLQRKGQYVHIGADGDRLVWIAAVGSVVPGERPRVYYTGELASVSDGRATFVDGTVLRLRRGVEAPVDTGFVIAEIDPGARQVVALRLP